MPNTTARSRSFRDAKGVTRTIEINPLSLARVRDVVGVDLLALVNTGLAATLAENMPALANVIGLLAFPADMPEREIAEALADDDVCPAAVDTLMLALADYLPARGRRLLKNAWAQTANA